MRKLTLFITSLFLFVGTAWAQLADGVYTISNTINNRGTMCYGTKDTWAGFGLAGIEYPGLESKSVTVEVDANKYWYVKTVEGKTYIYNVGQNKFLQSYQSGENASFGEDCAGFTMSEETHNETSYALVDSNGKNLAFSCGWNPNQGQIRWTNYEKDACCLTFTLVDGAEDTYKTEIGKAIVAINKSVGNYFATPEAGKYYKIKGEGVNPWLTANTTAGGNVVVSANEADAAVFLKTENGLQAVATRKYLGYAGGKYTYSDTELTIELRNTGDYLANYSNKYAIVSSGNYMFNNNTDGIVHESNQELKLERLWAFTEVEAPTVAEVSTLEALQDALANSELPIIITAQIEIPAGETVTIDLNGKTVNSVFNGASTTNHIYALSNRGTLTIQGNGSINSRGIYNYGSLTLLAGAINAIDGNGGYAVNNQSGSTFVMNGGVVAATNEDDHQSSSGGYDATALKVPAGCTATLNGGTINNVCDFTFAIDAAGTLNIPATSTITVNGTHGAIYVSGGETTINAGTFQIPADEYSRTDNVLYVSGGSLVVNGGTFIGDSDTASGGSCLWDEAGKAVVNGGTFKGSSGGDVWGTTGTTIKGGTFENLTEKKYIADGYELGADGTVAAKPVAAKIGEQGYATLNEAFAAATEGQTITLLDDATPALTSQRAITKAAVIDLGGKTMTLKEDDLYFGTTTFKNGTIVVDPSVKPSTAVFWMFANQTLTFDNVKVVATGVTGTYLIGLDGNNSDLNLLNGSEILVENTTALDLDIICVNASTGNDIKVENSKVNVTNLDGRVFFRGNYTVAGNSEINLKGITKAGFRIEAGQTLSIKDDAKVTIVGEPRDGGIHLTDLTATYTKAETATVNATVNEPKVAKVGENTYRTLAQAVAAVEDGGTITLIANETFTKTNRTHNSATWYDGLYYVGDKSFTIDLGGFTISQDGAVNDYLLNFKNSGSKDNTITLKNGTIDAGTAAFCAICTSSSQANDLTINTENINIINNISNGSTIKLRGGAVLNVKDGTKITGKNSYLGIECVASTVNIYDGAEIYMNGASSYNGCLVGACGGGTVNVYGGYGKGVKGGFIAMTSGGTINIEGGEWIANTDGTVGNNSNLYVLTAQSNKNESGFVGPSIINVTGGTFRGGMDAWVLNNVEGEKAELNISGGNFNADPTSYVEDDYIAVENNGVWNVVKATAKIGTTKYTSLEAAFKAATADCTIEILSDVTVDYAWDARKTGAKFTVPVTINGNGKKIKFTASVNDNNYQAPFRFEADATVKNLIVDMSEVTDNRFRAISSKGNLTVDGCKFIGKDETLNCRAIIFGEGAGANVGNLAIAITNSEFINWKRGITDNENAQDVKTVTITGNTLTDAGVGVSAKETVTFTGNTVAGAYVNIKSYTANNKLAVTATGNTLEANTETAYNVINAGGVVNAEGFNVVAKGNNFNGYTGTDGIWGETWGNARESFVIKVLDANGNVMGTTSLNNVGGIIDGDVNVSWNLKFNAAANTDEYWTMEWTTAPTLNNMPAKVELWVDGTRVSGGDVVLNGPDDLNKINVIVTDAEGKVTSCQTTVANALAAAKDGETVNLLWKEGAAPLAMNGSVFGKNVTITGTATVDWSKGFLFVGRGGAGNATVTFDGANLTSASDNASTGIHVSGREKNTNNKYDGTLVIKNSTIELDYLINKGAMTLDKATLTVKNGFAIGGRPASETENGVDATATISLTNGSKVVVNNHNGMGLGYEAIGVMSIDATSTFETTQSFLVTAKGTMNIAGTAKVEGSLTNNGAIVLTDAAATLTSTECGNVTTNVANKVVSYIDGKYTLTAAVAQIGDKYYATLQAAVDAVQNGETITFLSDITENVTLTEKTGLYYTIDGNGKKMNGTITISSLSDTEDNRRITIKGINFVTTEGRDFITSTATNHYPRLTVEGCSFTGTGKEAANTVAIRLKSSHSVVIKNCTGTGLHSFLQNTSGWNLTIENVKVTDSKSGFALGTVQGVTVKGCEIAAEGYGIRLDAGYNNNAVIESNKVEAFIPVVVRKASVDSNVTFQGTNTMTATNTDGLWMAVGTSEYEANGTMPTAATGKVVVTLNDTKLNREGIYGNALAGKGTEAEPFLIHSAKELEAFRSSVNAGETKYNAPGVWVALAADIDLANAEWTVGIGDGHNYSFDGNFDGKNHTIKNLNIKPYADADKYLCGGLFGYIYGGVTIKDLVIENVTITAEAEGHNVGILVGFANNNGGKANISNITVKGDVKVDAPNAYGVGAIVGYSYRAMGAITNTKVLANAGSYIKGQRFVGGITGYSYDNAVITGCTVKNLAISGAHGVAGIAGLAKNGNKITNCTVENVTVEAENNVAYIVGELQGEGGDVTVADNNAPQPWVGGSWGSGESLVATIGTQYFTTIAKAIEAAQAGDVISLIADVTASDIITINKAITLDGNGKKLTSTAGRAINVDCEGNVGIKNLTIDAKGERAINVITKPANVTIENVTATAANYTVNVAASAGAAKVAISKSTLNGLCTVNVASAGAQVTIDNSTVNCNDNNTTAGESYAALCLNKAAVGASIVAKNSEINVAAGSDSEKGRNGAENGTVIINGSTEGVTVTVAVITYPGSDNYHGFTSLADAIEFAKAGNTITLIRDVTLSDILVIDKAITLDGNGKTLTSTAGRAINVSGADGVTIKNLTINASGERAINVIQNATNVTIDNVTATAANYTVNLAGSTANAVVTVKNSNLTGLNVVNVAAPGAQVTVDETILNCADHNESEKYAVLALNKDAKGGSIVATNVTFNIEGDSRKATNQAQDGTVTIDGATDGVEVHVAYISYGQNWYGFATLEAAIAKVKDGETIELIRDVTMNYGAREAYATEATEVVINGNGKTLTLNQTNSDWSSFGLANGCKLVLNDMTINKSGKGATSGAWNTHAIIFSCPVEMTDVTVNNSVAVQAGAALTNVIINEANGYYGLWINGNGQAVTVNGGAINATNGGRGIKIADQYIDAPAQVTLSVDGTVFNTAKKAAVLVSSTAGAKITAANVSITNVAEDSENFVWVDEDWAQHFANVEVTGATVRAESAAAFTAAITANGAVQAYYKTLAEAINAAQAGATVELLADVTLAGGYTDATEGLRIEKEITLNGNDHTIDCGNFQKGIRVYNPSNESDFNVNFNNVKVVNNVANGRCIDTRSGNINLKVNSSTLIATNGNSQPLTIGGNDPVHRVTLNETTIDAGASGYAVISFVSTNVDIQGVNNSLISGFAAFYLKGDAKTTNLNLGQGVYTGTNNHAVESGVFGTVVLEGDNNVVNLMGTNATVKAIANNTAPQAAFLVRGANNTIKVTKESAKIITEGNAYEAIVDADNAATTKFIDMGVERNLVAEAKGRQFYSFEEAVRFAGNEGTIKVVNDFELAEAWTIPAGMEYTIDLNGKTISQTKECTASYEMICNKGNLTITDSSDAKDGKLSFKDTGAGDPNFGWGSYTVRNEGNLVVENGTIEHLGAQTFGTHCIMAIYQYCGSTTINGGKISTPNYRSARLWKGEMTINGGTFDGQVWVQAVDNTAKLTVNGGTFEPNGNDASAVFVTNNQYDVQFAVTDGTFNGKVGCSNVTKLANAITGGKFNAAAVAGTSKDLIAFGYEFGAADADGYQAVYNDESVLYIETLADLKAFRDAVNSGANYYAGVNVVLAADIDMAGENWVGIGSATKDHGFMGNFDGNGKTIKNLTITNPALDSDGYAYAGLFGVTEGTDKNNQNTIKNLTIENVTITTTGHIAAAAIAYPYYTIVDNVKVCGDIKIQGGDYTAGVLAYTRRCVNASNLAIVGNTGSFVKGNQVVGGVISDIQMNGGLTAVYNNFSAEGLTVTGAKNVGGISGIIATQTLDGATVKNVALECGNASAGSVSGALGGTSTISNVTVENVTGATALLGTTYNGGAIEAKIGDTYYATIENAYVAAQAGATVELLAPVVIASGETLTLDKDVTVVYTSNVAGEDMFTNRGTLNISAGTITYVNTDKTGSNVTVSTISNEPGSVLNITGGTVENKTVKADGSSIYSYAIDMLTNGNLGDVTATIAGGTVYSDYMAIRQFNNGTACKNTLTINGGYIYGAKRAVQVHLNNNAAYTTISGGKVEAGADGYAICNFAATGNLEVTGGEFIGAVYSARENFISGGIYDAEVYAGYCATGYMPNKNVDGTYGVVAVADAYASIDGVTYGSLKAAVAAAKAGETITLLQDVKENVTISKHLTIDGAGKTIIGMITTDGKSLKVTIKNVNFDGNNKTVNYAMRADDDLNLVVENCYVKDYLYGFLYANKSNDKIVVKNVTVENCAEYGAYLVAFNSASFENFTVKGATKYGIAVANAGARNVTLKNVSFENAETPLSINEIGTGKVTFTFEGVNDMGKPEFYTSQYVNVVAAAQVGTKVCGSLQDAVVAANDGDTVKVIADVNMTTANFVTQVDGYATLVNVAGKAVTIDLNGKKVTVNAADADLNGKAKGNMLMSVFHADPNGTLTLTDSSAEGTGTVELFANDATVYGLIVSENANDKTNPGKIIVNGGNYIADKLSDSMIFADINEVITVNGGNFRLGNVGTGDNGKPWIFNASGNNQIHINVNGGTYNANVAKQYWTNEVNLGEGLTTTNNGNGTWTVVPAVAAVGEEIFGSIQEAIDAAQDGQTVKLIADVAYTDADAFGVEEKPYSTMLYVQGKNITLDMNGKKIDVTYTGSLLYSVVLVSDGAGLTVTGEGAINAVGCNADGTAAKNIAYMFWKRGTTGYLVIENGSFYMNDAADSMVYTNGDEIVTVNGGTFTLTAVASQANGWPVIFSTQGNNEKQIVVNGGTFNYDINHQQRPFEVYVAPEKALKKVQIDGVDMWTIVAAQAYVTEKLGDFVNATGDNDHNVGYATVAEAFAAVKSGETVTMVADAALTETVVVPAGKEVVLDLNGMTISAAITEQLTKSFAAIQNRGTLTVKDASTDADGKISVSYAGNSFGYGVGLYTISNEGGVLNIEGGTVENTTTVDGSMYDAIDNNSTLGETVLNISGGEVVCGKYIGVRQFANNTTYDNIVNVTGGKVVGGNTSIWMQNPGSNQPKATIAISGADYENGNYPVIEGRLLAGESTGFNFEVTGGLFTTDENLNEFCADSYASYNFGDGTWGVEYLVVDEFVINHGEYTEFENQNAKTVGKLTYNRTISAKNLNVWQALYVPFEIPVEALGDDYDVAYFNDFRETLDDEGNIVEGKSVVELVKINSGKTLKANHPYVIRAKNADALNMSLTFYDVKLYSTVADSCHSVECSSATKRFEFFGTYKQAGRTELTGNDKTPCYAMGGGTLGAMPSDDQFKLNPFLIYMTKTNKDGSPYIENVAESHSIALRLIGEEAEDGTTIIYDVEMDETQDVDYIYDLQGRRVLEPQKGNLYIINGKKVIF